MTGNLIWSYTNHINQYFLIELTIHFNHETNQQKEYIVVLTIVFSRINASQKTTVYFV